MSDTSGMWGTSSIDNDTPEPTPTDLEVLLTRIGRHAIDCALGEGPMVFDGEKVSEWIEEFQIKEWQKAVKAVSDWLYDKDEVKAWVASMVDIIAENPENIKELMAEHGSDK